MKRYILFISSFIIMLTACNKNGHDLASGPAIEKNSKSSEMNNADNKENLKYSQEQLDNTKGLSNSSVNCIFQDSQNLLWIGTWDGLNRYDGNDFKIFRPGQDDKNSISNHIILKIGEDNRGDIWVSTMHGINRYDKKSGKFEHFYFSRNNKPPLSESEFNIALDGSKNVFCAVKEWGIGYFDGKKFQPLKGGNFLSKTVKKIEFSEDNELLILFEDNELYAVKITIAGADKVISQTKKISGDIRTFDVLSNKFTCAISLKGNAILFSPSFKIKQIVSGKSIDNIVGHIPEGIVFSSRSGYLITDFNGNAIVRNWSKFLSGQKITTLLYGSENVIWTGTDGDGVFKMYPLKKTFNLISKSVMPELDGAIVRAFLKSEDNSFWMGTKGKGLFHFSSEFYLNNDKPLAYTYFNESNSTINNSVFALSKGNNNLMFIGTDGDGITVYDIATSKLVNWSQINGNEKCDYFKSVYAIYQDEGGAIWIGTNGYGMICCRIERTNVGLRVTDFKRYVAGNKTGSLSSNIIFSIVSKNRDQLWIGTRLGGLNLFNKESGKFKTYTNVPNNANTLSNNDILCMVTDAHNKLWIGTSFGLNLLENLSADGNAVFKSFTVKDGLPNNTIHGITTDKKSNLWISTNFGLSNFAIKQMKFTNYSKNEGLQNNEFSDGAYYNETDSGYIFMGGIKGFNYFLPQTIKESRVLPELFIEKISGQNQVVPYYQSLVISPDSHTYPSIILEHDQNFFDIHLSALTYTNNEKCQYAYQLKGFDEGWNVIGNRKIISFTNVPRGKYSLWVKWSNTDGVWTKPVQAMDIKIKPVWWQSNTALVIYVVLLMSFILFVRSYYLKRKSLQQNILSRKNEEEIHENRLSFFTNIAHEFLTPLTLIAGPVQKLSEAKNLDEKNRKFISMVQRNASRLILLTQQLLEFRKAEYDYLEISVRKFNLVTLIEQIAELFDEWAFDKNIDYQLDIPSTLPGWFDKDKLEKILFNLMSNAFKYTPVKGSIKLVCKIESGNPKRLNITVTNTGKGIPKEKLDSLFDRFFLSDINQTSDTQLFRTGIGLAYINKLVTLLHGEIKVSSIADKETSFTILIPCEKSAFTEKEIDESTAPVLISHHLKNIIEEITEDSEIIPQKISAIDVIENDKKKILVVEDEKEIHVFLNDLLSEKYKILSAFNGIEALDLMNSEIPDVIISDVMMPLMDGVELCKRVKTNLRTCHIPFIMLTAKNSVLHKIEGLENGANSYIPKPFYPDHLLVRIQKLLEEKELILKHFTQDALLADVLETPSNNEQKTFIKLVIEAIRENIDNENLNSAYIEKKMGISNSQLYRKTKDIFGLSPGDLIRTIRLKYSAELLRKNVLTVSEVCYKSGFNNRSYFYREFKKVYNTTPKNYQLQYKLKDSHFSKN